MKQCSTCREEFADKFSFCPVDGTPLDVPVAETVQYSTPEGEQAPPSTPPSADAAETFQAQGVAASTALVPANEYHLTFVDDTGLTRRLVNELKEVAHHSELTWPEFKRDPFGYTGRFFKGYGSLFWKFISSRNVAIGVTAGFLVVMTAILLMVIAEKRGSQQELAQQAPPDMILENMVETDIPDEPEKEKPDEGIGTGKGGRVGFNKGKGEGSKPEFAKAGGGGGGGMKDELPPQQGRTPPPSEMPSQIPNTPPVRTPALPVAGINIDPALYKSQNYDRFGDPRSTSTATSSGPGTGNGIGTGNGQGIGQGNGTGFGPGNDKNMGGGDYRQGGGGAGGGTGNNGEVDYNKVFNPREVSQKARILSRPEPQYTEEARKNQVSGTVVLRAVFSSGGQVTNIRAVSGLPYGLTERAIAAARQIRFSPAMKDGRAVSQYIQIEYNFNLY